MDTTEHLQERLKNPDLSDEVRKVLQKALDTHGPSYQGFKVGDRITAWDEPGVVISWEEFDKAIPDFTKEHKEEQKWVPFRADNYQNINAAPASRVKLA